MNVEIKPGIAATERRVSAICCHRLVDESERREGGKVIITTAFEDRTIPFRDLIKESISHSCKVIR